MGNRLYYDFRAKEIRGEGNMKMEYLFVPFPFCKEDVDFIGMLLELFETEILVLKVDVVFCYSCSLKSLSVFK